MSTIEASPAAQRSGEFQQPVVNDFSIQVATVNGSGSQTANSVLMRAIFQMGIPVSGKNMFPSNIQGLPTWFTIRASRSEEHTSELQSQSNLVCRLLLEKKKKNTTIR